MESMRQYITKIVPSLTTLVCALVVVMTVVNGAWIFSISYNFNNRRIIVNDKFPIESFIMVTQETKLYDVICDDQQINCAPGPAPTSRMAATGSGVIIGEYKGASLVLTAGHVCSAPGNGTPVTQDMSVQYTMHLESGFGREGFGTILAVDSTNDLCILIADAMLGPVLHVADHDPIMHEKVYTMSSPRGLAVPLAVPVFDGYYSGQVGTMYVFSVPAAPGSSGSPMLNENGEIISIISGAAISFDEFAIGCTAPALRNFVLAVRASL